MQKKLYSWFFKKEYNANDTETEFPGAVRKLLEQYPKCQENIKKLFCGEHFPPCFPDESPRVYSLCQPLCDQIATDCPGFFRQVCNVIYFFQGEPAGEGKDRVGVGNMYGAVVRFSDPSPFLPPPFPPSFPLPSPLPSPLRSFLPPPFPQTVSARIRFLNRLRSDVSKEQRIKNPDSNCKKKMRRASS